jgi:hypothetical protein
VDAIVKEPVVVGRVARAELCPCGNSVVLSVGALSLRLEFSAASDVAQTLQRFLAGVEPPAAAFACDGTN